MAFELSPILDVNRFNFIIGVCVLLFVTCVLNFASLLITRIADSADHRPLRPGSFTIFFYLAVVLHFCVISIPCAYLLFHVWNGVQQGLMLGAVSVHTAFWVICLYRLVKERHYYEYHILLIVNYVIAAILVIVPLIFWRIIFPFGFAEKSTLFYVCETFCVVTLFLIVLSKATLKKDYYSPWDNFFNKCKRIWRYVWPKKSIKFQFYIVICVLLLLIGRVINIFVPLYSKWIVDSLSEKNPPFCYKLILIATVLKFLQGNGANGGFLNTIRSFLWIGIQQYTTLEIQVDVIKYLHQLSLKFHLTRRTGELVRIMDRGTNSINTLLSYVLFNVFPTIVDILLASVFFFVQFNVYFGFLVIVVMTSYLVATVSLTEWRSKYRKEMNENENRASSIGVDSLLNYETIKYYNAEELEVNRFKNAYKLFQNAEFKSNASLAFLNIVQNSIIGVGLIIGSLLVAYLISLKDSGMTAGDYVMFTTYILQLYTPLNFFGTIYRVIQRSFIDMENMLNLFENEIEICDVPGAIELDKVAGAIEFRDVSFSYKPERLVLNNISFSVNPGETIALVGPSGSGKTTIIRLLFRLYDVTDGQICFNGHDIRALKCKSLRSHIGIVPQDTVLFNETIRYNIGFGRPSAGQEEIEDAAKAASIHQFIISHPDGYDCLVGERGLKLSGGEKQRVAIARTILKNPEYILLDEATSALDSKTERSIQKYLFDLCNRRTCIIVAHRLSTIVHAHKILVLNEGRIAEVGTHEELLAKNGIYAEMWSLQRKNGDESENGNETTTSDSSIA